MLKQERFRNIFGFRPARTRVGRWLTKHKVRHTLDSIGHNWFLALVSIRINSMNSKGDRRAYELLAQEALEQFNEALSVAQEAGYNVADFSRWRDEVKNTGA